MSKTKALFFIINEHSGSGKGRQIEKIVSQFQNDYTFTAELHKTQSPGHAGELAARIAEQSADTDLQPIIVSVGGDGTLNEVVSGLGDKYPDLPIACIPAGSGNDFARSHNLPLDTEAALRHLLTVNEPTRLDILTHKEKGADKTRYAVNSLGIGIDASVIHLLNHSKRKEKLAQSGLGKTSYLATVLSAYFKQHPFSVNLIENGKSTLFDNCILLLSANHPYFGGGLKIHPGADPSDNTINVIVAEKLSFIELLRLLMLILTKGSHLSHPKVHTLEVSAFSASVQPEQFGQADGEELPAKEYKLDISVIQRAFWI